MVKESCPHLSKGWCADCVLALQRKNFCADGDEAPKVVINEKERIEWLEQGIEFAVGALKYAQRETERPQIRDGIKMLRETLEKKFLPPVASKKNPDDELVASYRGQLQEAIRNLEEVTRELKVKKRLKALNVTAEKVVEAGRLLRLAKKARALFQ